MFRKSPRESFGSVAWKRVLDFLIYERMWSLNDLDTPKTGLRNCHNGGHCISTVTVMISDIHLQHCSHKVHCVG